MSQFIVLGTGDKNYNISNNPISGLQEDSLLFVKNGYIAGIAPPTYNNNILQWDSNTQEFVWNQLTLSTVIGDNETNKGILWNDASDYLHMMSAETGVYQVKIENDVYTLVPAKDGDVKEIEFMEEREEAILQTPFSFELFIILLHKILKLKIS